MVNADSKRWSHQKERGSKLGVLIATRIYKLVGRRVSMVVLAPVTLFFYLNGTIQRRASSAYLNRAFDKGLIRKKPNFWTGFAHFYAFTGSMLDKVASWSGQIGLSQIDGILSGPFYDAETSGRGALILTGHIGNTELIRAIVTVNSRFSVTVLVHTDNAEQFNSVINQFSDKSTVSILQIREIDIKVAMELAAKVEAGEWIVLTGDRPPPLGGAKDSTVSVDFLGAPARFPIGPYVVAAALKCPTYFLACIRKEGKPPFAVEFKPFADPVVLPRKDRQQALQNYAQLFANHLEAALRKAPLQWFNFFDFWNEFSDNTDTSDKSIENDPKSVS